MKDAEILDYITVHGDDSFCNVLRRARRQNALACGPVIRDVRVLMAIARQMGIVQGYPPAIEKAEAAQ